VRKIVLDTNAYSAFFSGDMSVRKAIVVSDMVQMSTIVIGELYFGFFGGTKFSQNKDQLEAFLKKSNIHVIGVTVETAEIFGEIQNELKGKGKPIPINDVWIAAQAIESGAKLVTFDAHFENISGLRIWDESVGK